MKNVFASFAMLVMLGCGEADQVSSANKIAIPPVQNIDEDSKFAGILEQVDAVIGKRFQFMEMAAMVSATYQYDGPLDTVSDVVEPLVKEIGYESFDSDMVGAMGDAEKHMQDSMNMKMGFVDGISYKHENGNMISIIRMNVSHGDVDMKLLTVQMMNPNKMGQ